MKKVFGQPLLAWAIQILTVVYLYIWHSGTLGLSGWAGFLILLLFFLAYFLFLTFYLRRSERKRNK